MIEQKLEKIENEIKATKSSMPISGSLMDTYFYNKTELSPAYQDGYIASFTVKFTPTNIAAGEGITNLYEYCELIVSDSYWSQFNPMYLNINQGYYMKDGIAQFDDSFFAAGYGNYNIRATISVFSTVPGSVSIEWHEGEPM